MPLAIELEVPDDDAIEVTYDDEFVFLSHFLDSGVDCAVRTPLARKTKIWQHEMEVRVIANDTYSHLPNPIRRVIIGPRMTRATTQAVANICERHKIKFDRAIVADWGFYTMGVQGFDW